MFSNGSLRPAKYLIQFKPELAAGLLGDAARPIPVERQLSRRNLIATHVPQIPLPA
jgi:hypothetical protein